MKLQSVEVTDYKSIRRSTPFGIGDITCLVGKNESGKTSLLEALYRLNPIIPTAGTFDVTEDFPRADVEDYRQALETGKREAATVICAEFLLEDKDTTDLRAKFGDGVLAKPLVTLTKGYANALKHDFTANESSAIQGLVASSQIPADIASEAKTKVTLKELASFLTEKSKSQAAAHTEATTAAAAIADETEKAKALDQAKQLSESEAAKQLRTLVLEIQKAGLKEYIWKKYIESAVPKFLYFDEYYQMKGLVNIEQLLERQRTGALLSSDHPQGNRLLTEWFDYCVS